MVDIHILDINQWERAYVMGCHTAYVIAGGSDDWVLPFHSNLCTFYIKVRGLIHC